MSAPSTPATRSNPRRCCASRLRRNARSHGEAPLLGTPGAAVGSECRNHAKPKRGGEKRCDGTCSCAWREKRPYIRRSRGSDPRQDAVRAALASASWRFWTRSVFRAGVGALTASELRTARLAAEGLSNVEIAQRLFVTRKTVEKHLSNAYAKLEIGSREELPAVLDQEPR